MVHLHQQPGAQVLFFCLIVMLMFGVGGCALGSKDSSETIFLPPVGMNPSGPYISERTGALAFWGNGSLESRVDLRKGQVAITIRARGHAVGGEPPHVRLSLDQREIGVVGVDSKLLKDYRVTVLVDHSGPTMVRLSFENYVPKPDPLDSRHLFVEMVSLQQLG